MQMTLHYSWYFVAPVLRALAAERDALKEDKRVLSIALMDAQRHGDDLSARVAELEAYADAKDAELRRAYALATEAESRCADLEAALREAYEQAAKVAEEHRCEVIADGTPDTIIDAHVNGVLSGYQDAVKQIAGAIRALAPPQAPKE